MTPLNEQAYNYLQKLIMENQFFLSGSLFRDKIIKRTGNFAHPAKRCRAQTCTGRLY